MEPTQVIFTYKGVEVRMNADHEFVTDGERSFDSAAQVKNYIDSAEKKKAKVEKPTISLAVIAPDGSKLKITSLHASQGKVLTTPKHDFGYSYMTLYPDSPIIELLLAEELRLKRELNRVQDLLTKMRLDGIGGFQSSDGDDDVVLNNAYLRVTREHAGKLASAGLFTTLEQILAKYGEPRKSHVQN